MHDEYDTYGEYGVKGFLKSVALRILYAVRGVVCFLGNVQEVSVLVYHSVSDEEWWAISNEGCRNNI